MPTTSLDLHIELDPDSDLLRGRAEDAEGGVHPFVGWLGLIAVLDAVLGDAADEADPA